MKSEVVQQQKTFQNVRKFTNLRNRPAVDRDSRVYEPDNYLPCPVITYGSDYPSLSQLIRSRTKLPVSCCSSHDTFSQLKCGLHGRVITKRALIRERSMEIYLTRPPQPNRPLPLARSLWLPNHFVLFEFLMLGRFSAFFRGILWVAGQEVGSAAAVNYFFTPSLVINCYRTMAADWGSISQRTKL